MINATKVFSSAWALTSLDLKSLFCSKASFVRIAAAVSIAIVCLFYRIELAHEGPTVSLDYTTLSRAVLPARVFPPSQIGFRLINEIIGMWPTGLCAGVGAESIASRNVNFSIQH